MNTANSLSYEPCLATGVILAGGRSRRMGRDKLPLKVGDTTLLERVVSALSSRCEEVLVVGKRGRAPAGVRRLPDLRPGRQGPLAGIEAGLVAARHQAVFVAAGDMPFLTGDLVGCLLGLLSEQFWSRPKSREGYRQGAAGYEETPTPRSEATLAVVPDLGGSHPLCAAYAREARPLVSAALDEGTRSVRGLLEILPEVRYVGGAELRRFGDPEVLLANVNSPEDLARARDAFHR